MDTKFKPIHLNDNHEREKAMKPIKMRGLAALAALMAMAFVGASSAMAEPTALCSAEEELCAEGNNVTHVHEETLSEAKGKLLAGRTGTVECDALFLGESLVEGEPLVIHGNFTYTNCRLGGTNCTVTEESTTSLLEVLKLGHESADITGEDETRIRCGIFINCVYNRVGLLATATGPLLSSFSNGDVTIASQTINKVSGICPSTGELDISTMPLSVTYIVSEGVDQAIYCVQFQHAHGLYPDERCKSRRLERREGQFELVSAEVGLRVGDPVCSRGSAGEFLYEDRRCTEDDRNNRSSYERGKVVS